jgi:hypothetical protein
MIRPAAIVVLLVCAGCDKTMPSAPAPTSPTPTAPSVNQLPLIVVDTVAPALGIRDVTTFTFRVDVRDPDGDQVALTVSGCSFATDSPIVLENGSANLSFTAARRCGSSLALKATDAKGAVTRATVPFEATDLNDSFRLVIGDGFYSQPYFYVTLTQTGSMVTGTIRDQRDHQGTTDPGTPGTIDAEGRFRLRFKISSEDDLTVTGQVISGGRDLFSDVTIATGTVTGAAFRGRAFKLWHEAQY